MSEQMNQSQIKTDTKKWIWIATVGIMLLFLSGRFLLIQGRALVTRVVSDRAYEVYIDDRLGLMTEEEREALEKQLSELTVYGNMVFLDTGEHDYSGARGYAEARYRDLCDTEPGVVFLIDMDNREIWLAATGSPKNKLTSAICYEITDRTYLYATNGDYYICASETFTEAQNILEGGYLFPIMRILVSLFLSLIVALTINLFRLILSRTTQSKLKNSPTIYGLLRKKRSQKEIYKTVKKRYHGSSDGGFSGGGGGGSSSGGGGGGGGGFSGGGHSF